jgi:hypothetical protein
MFHKLLFLLSSLFFSTQAFALNVPIHIGGPNCDTLITVDGKTFIINIQDASTDFILFTKCDDAKKTNYTIPWSQVKSLIKSKVPISIDSTNIKPVAFDKIPQNITKDRAYYNEHPEECDELIFKDGREIKVIIVSKDLLSYYYSICGETDDRVYMAPMAEVRLYRRSKFIKPDKTKNNAYKSNNTANKSNNGSGCLLTLGITLGVILALILLIAAFA